MQWILSDIPFSPISLRFKPKYKPTSYKNWTCFSNISIWHSTAPKNAPTGRTRKSTTECFQSTMFRHLNQSNFRRKNFNQYYFNHIQQIRRLLTTGGMKSRKVFVIPLQRKLPVIFCATRTYKNIHNVKGSDISKPSLMQDLLETVSRRTQAYLTDLKMNSNLIRDM